MSRHKMIHMMLHTGEKHLNLLYDTLSIINLIFISTESIRISSLNFRYTKPTYINFYLFVDQIS